MNPDKFINKFRNRINQVLVFYFPVRVNYWDTVTPCRIKENRSSIGSYYLDFRSKYPYPGNLSEGGIPLYHADDGKEIYHPTVICQYALGLYDWMSDKGFNDKKLYERFIAQAEWLLANQQQLTHGQGWILDYKIPEYNISFPWISALTQGEAISVLCRAYLLSKNKIFIDAAENALIPFEYSVAEGGLSGYFNEIKIFEEYPCQKPNVVLNGWIFAIFGFYDLYLINSNEAAKKLFDISIDSLKRIIDFFDVKYWTQYNLFHHPDIYLSSFKYHSLHIEQLKALYLITNEEILKDTYCRWESYKSKYSFRTKVLFKKLLHDK